MNMLFMQGRIPFEPNFFEANGDRKAFAVFILAVNTGIKDEETGYYKEDNFKCTVSGGWAENLMKNWNNKMVVDIYGKLVMGKDYEKDGEIVKGQPEIRVAEIHEYNTLDKTILRARIANFDGGLVYTPATDGKKSYARVKLSVSTGIKDEETGYYKERLINAKAFGATADFLDKFYQQGDYITVDGRYQDAKEYEKDGEIVRPQPELLINSIHGFARKKDTNENGQTDNKKAPSRANKLSLDKKPMSPAKPKGPKLKVPMKKSLSLKK